MPLSSAAGTPAAASAATASAAISRCCSARRDDVMKSLRSSARPWRCARGARPWARTRSTGAAGASPPSTRTATSAASAASSGFTMVMVHLSEGMRRYRRNPHTAGRVVDGLAFVVTPDDNKLHTLNGSATRLWTIAKGAPITAEDAALALIETYDVDEATARTDALACLEDLVARAILVATDDDR